MILSFHPCIEAHHHIILGDRKLTTEDLSLIHAADVIILPQTCSYSVYQTCVNTSALLFPNYDARFTYPGKTGQARLFKHMALPHPKTIIWRSIEELARAIKEDGAYPHEMPFFLKADVSHEAEGVYLIKDTKSLESGLARLSRLYHPESRGFLTQDLIPSGGNVLRAVIIGREIITYWKRPTEQNKIITTIRQGATIDKDWRMDLQDKGRTEARTLTSITEINLAAIDFVFPLNDPNPEPLFLEINYYFGRKGLGGSVKYYHRLFQSIQEWLKQKGFNPRSISLV